MILRLGDRVQFISGSSDGKTGTVIRLGGVRGDIHIVAMDELYVGASHNSDDLAGAKALGIDISNSYTIYATSPRFKPIVDAKSPPGTKVRIKQGKEEADGVFVFHDGEHETQLCCVPPSSSSMGSVGAMHSANRNAAIAVGLNPDTDRYVFARYEQMTFLSSPEPKGTPVKPVKPAFKPGDKIQWNGSGGGECVFICSSQSEGYVIIGGVELGLRCKTQEYVEAVKALGLDPESREFMSVKMEDLVPLVEDEDRGEADEDEEEEEYDEGESDDDVAPDYASLRQGDTVKLNIKGSSGWVEVEGVVFLFSDEADVYGASEHDPIVMVALTSPLPEGADCDKPIPDEIAAAKKLGLTLTNANCWVCDTSDTRVIANLGPRKDSIVSLAPALMLAGAALGGFISAICKASAPAARVADVSEPMIEIEEEVKEAVNADR